MKATYAYRQLPDTIPEPVVPVTLRHPATKAAVDLTLVVDTGAEVTVVPHSAAVAVGLTDEVGANLSGFDGSTSGASVATADLILEGWVVRLPIYCAEMGEGVLGRNVLALLTVALDGPRRTLTIEKV